MEEGRRLLVSQGRNDSFLDTQLAIGCTSIVSAAIRWLVKTPVLHCHAIETRAHIAHVQLHDMFSV